MVGLGRLGGKCWDVVVDLERGVLLRLLGWRTGHGHMSHGHVVRCCLAAAHPFGTTQLAAHFRSWWVLDGATCTLPSRGVEAPKSSPSTCSCRTQRRAGGGGGGPARQPAPAQQVTAAAAAAARGRRAAGGACRRVCWPARLWRRLVRGCLWLTGPRAPPAGCWSESLSWRRTRTPPLFR